MVVWDINNSSGVGFSEDFLTAISNSTTNSYKFSASTKSKSSGLWYWEIKVVRTGGFGEIGVFDASKTIPAGTSGSTSNAVSFRIDGVIRVNGTNISSNHKNISDGDIVSFALDMDSKKITFYINGEKQGSGNVPFDEVVVFSRWRNAWEVRANFGNSKFYSEKVWDDAKSQGFLPYDKVDGGNNLHTYKILLLKEFSNEVKSIDVDKNAIVDIPEQSEEYFISNGLDTVIDNLNADYTQKHYINNQSTPLGDGKVFEQPLDIDKIIKNVRVT